ncbi:hypothetical protein, partial [Desulfobulbus propionicus]
MKKGDGYIFSGIFFIDAECVTIQLATLIFSKKVLDRFLGEIFIFPASLPPAHFSHHEASSWAHGA